MLKFEFPDRPGFTYRRSFFFFFFFSPPIARRSALDDLPHAARAADRRQREERVAAGCVRRRNLSCPRARLGVQASGQHASVPGRRPAVAMVDSSSRVRAEARHDGPTTAPTSKSFTASPATTTDRSRLILWRTRRRCAFRLCCGRSCRWRSQRRPAMRPSH